MVKTKTIAAVVVMAIAIIAIITTYFSAKPSIFASTPTSAPKSMS